MKINVFDQKNRPNLSHSWEAEDGARRLLERIDNMDMALEILPNDSSQFTSLLEEKDYMSYCGFLESVTGRKIIELLEALDEE